MSPPRRRRRIPRPDCSSVLLSLTVVAAGVWTVLHAVALWVTGHPGLIALVLGLMAAGGISGGAVGARRDRARAGRLARTEDYLRLSPAQFEQALAGLCRRDGCRDIRVVGGSGDLGADVLATTGDGRRILIQAKRYAVGRRVGSPDVQRVGGTYSVVHGAQMAIVVTTASYTAEAEGYARTAGIRLVDGAELATWAAGETAPPWGGERRMRA